MAERVLSLTLKYCGKTFTESVNLPSDMLTQEERDNMDPLVMSESYLPMLVEYCRQLSVKWFKDYLKMAETLDHSLPGEENIISDKAPIQERNGEELPPSSTILTSSSPNETSICLGSVGVIPDFDQPEPEHKTSEAGITFNQHAQQTKMKYEAHEAFWKTNKEKIKKDYNTYPDIDALYFALTYSEEKKIKYRFFHSEQSALSWAYKNIHHMDEFLPFIRTWPLKAMTTLMATDLQVTPIKLTHPLEPNNVILEMNGLPDTFSDRAFIPFDPHISNKLINSATILNGELVPTVYGKLTICGEELKNIYEIELDSDGESCAIGVPQMKEMKPHALKRIMKKYIRKLYS